MDILLGKSSCWLPRYSYYTLQEPTPPLIILCLLRQEIFHQATYVGVYGCRFRDRIDLFNLLQPVSLQLTSPLLQFSLHFLRTLPQSDDAYEWLSRVVVFYFTPFPPCSPLCYNSSSFLFSILYSPSSSIPLPFFRCPFCCFLLLFLFFSLLL